MPENRNITIISVVIDTAASRQIDYINGHLTERYGTRPSRSAIIRAALALYSKNIAERAGDQLPTCAA